MNKIFKSYRHALILITVLCGMENTYGQAVKGDKYVYDYIPKATPISYNWDGTVESSTGNIGLIFDENDDTYWVGKGDQTQVRISVDFGRQTQITSMRIMGGGDASERASSITVQRRNNTTEWWSNVGTYTVNDRTITITFNPTINYRYLRITFNKNTDGAFAFNSIDIYGASVRIDDRTINHKHPKWFELRNDISESARRMDTFDETTKMFTPNDNPIISAYPPDKQEIQAAHTYIDTIYMHRGASIELALPDYLSTSTVRSYQRWYSFRTDRTFRTVNHTNDVYDLLTPKDGTKVVRLTNGYVGYPVADDASFMNFYMPTENEFNDFFPDADGFDDDWFIVACDVSGYTDYTETFSKTESKNSSFINANTENCWEPTLSHRVLFYISAVDDRKQTDAWVNGHGRLTRSEYQGGGNTENDKYLEEYSITFPATRLNHRTGENHSDVVALSKDALGYAIPGLRNTSSDVKKLQVKVDNNSAGISLLKDSVSGASRIIQFNYPGADNTTSRLTVKGPAATILVTKTVAGTIYNIARYKLTFAEDATMLTQTIINRLSDDSSANDGDWAKYKNRTPDYLDKNYQMLTMLNWDYDKNVGNEYGHEEYYQFPMNWEYSSYSFYDGAPVRTTSDRGDFIPKTTGAQYPEWGYYSITNEYIETHFPGNPKGATSPSGGTYHLYVDASDRPGTITQLPFRETLCQGTELFISAWVKDAGYSSNGSGSGMLFTVMGVEEFEDGSRRRMTPLYRYSPGQILHSDYMDSNIPGCGTNTNDWMHIYFSFINNNNVEYDSYLLQVDNNSVSTDGGDMYLDDIRVYVATPSAIVQQLEASCTGEKTRMNIELDWDRLMSRTGGNGVEGTGGKFGAIDFCFVDRKLYEEKLAELVASGGDANAKETIKTALEASVVKTGQGDNEQDFSQLHYYLDYNENRDYNDPKLGTDGPLAGNNMVEVPESSKKRGAFYRREVDGNDYLSVDFFSTLSANRSYWMLINLTRSENQEPEIDDFTNMNEACAIRTEFYVTSTNLVMIQGEWADPTKNEYCEGQLLNFNVNMRYPTGKRDEYGNAIYGDINDVVFHDWFFGTEEDFNSTSQYGVSLKDALETFRETYPTAEKLPDTYETKSAFTKEMYDLLDHYIKLGKPDGSTNPVLTLYKSSMNIRLQRPGLELIISPVKKDLSIDEGLVCWTYIPLSLRVMDGAPQLKAGFTGINYHDGDYAPKLRIGLEQIKKTASGNKEYAIIYVLRDAKYVSTNATNLGLITENAHESDNYLYLIDTTDPEMKALFAGSGHTPYDFPIGWVDELHATETGYSGETGNRMKIRFDLNGELKEGFKFIPREGFSYTFSVYFEEKIGSTAGNACIGTFNVDMLVVPEYIVWDGNPTDNWNNDNNWKRVNDPARINKTTGYGTYTENSFVPMQFSKIIIPENKKIELYVAGYDQGSSWDNHLRPGYIGTPTENIQYDLMAVEQDNGTITTNKYRTYWVDQVHFEPGAEMRHAEYLIYNKAWVNYELDLKKWYTLTSPLQGVVAGDFYTNKATFTDKDEYFHTINWASTDNDRMQPAVYQRPWDAADATLQKVSTTQNVAIQGNWGSTYNDVDASEAYEPGRGFSIKVTGNGHNNARFRLPKNNSGYNYNTGSSYNYKDVTGKRTNAGKLITDSMYIRVAENFESSQGKPFTVTLESDEATQDGKKYYLVGNPFMTSLDAAKFFEKNTNLKPSYWTGNGQQAAVGSEAGWIETTGAGTRIAPLQSFFVEKADGATINTVTFEADMQASFNESNTDATVYADAMRITATTTDGRSSHAAVAYSNGTPADNGGAELFIDSNIGNVPMVYTVGGNRALSINTATAGSRIPLSVYGLSNEDVTLHFTGVETHGDVRLYDAQTKTETALADGSTVTVRTNDDGRYYLTGGTVTGITDSHTAGQDITVYSVRSGEITVVSSGTALQQVTVYDMGGGIIARKDAEGAANAIRVQTQPRTNCIVTAKDTAGKSRTVKLQVR